MIVVQDSGIKEGDAKGKRIMRMAISIVIPLAPERATDLADFVSKPSRE